MAECGKNRKQRLLGEKMISKFSTSRLEAMKEFCERAISAAELGDRTNAIKELARAKIEREIIYARDIFPLIREGKLSELSPEQRSLITEANKLYTDSFKEARRRYENYEKNILN